MCDLSLVIVSWNARAYLVQALESIAATAARHRVEVIVVDNDSADGSPEAVEALFPQARLIRSGANLGFAKANNLGIRQSRGRLVGLVNSDVTVLPECLDRLVEFMDAHPRVGMAGPEVLNPDGSLQNSHWDFPSVRGMLARMLALDTLARKLKGAWERRVTGGSTPSGSGEMANGNPGFGEYASPGAIKKFDPSRVGETMNTVGRFEKSAATGVGGKADGNGARETRHDSIRNPQSAIRNVDVLSGCFMVLRREALERVGLLDEDFYIYGEDMDLCRRFHGAGWEVACFADARAIHAGGASSANAPVRFFIELQKANLRYWTKHHGRAGGLFFKGAALIHHLLRLAGSSIIYLFVPHLRLVTRQKIQRSAKCIEWLLRRAPATDSGAAGQPARKKEENETGLGARNP